MTGKRFIFDERGCSFGRSYENDLVMPDPNRYVSSRHGMVTFENGVFSIHDQSSNGLFADNATVPIGVGRPFVLQNGTSLKAGEYVLEVGIEEDAHQPAAVLPGNGARIAADARPVLKEVPTPSLAPRSTPPEGGGSGIEEIALELALRLGLHGMSEDKLLQMPKAVTEVVRSCVAGIMDVLSSRRQIKHELRMDTTMIRGAHNNALKFSATADEAIERMFTKSGDGYLPPETALLEAFQDIADHQVAMMTATVQVYQEVVERFDPEVLEESLRRTAKEGGWFSRKPRLWEEYRKRYQGIASSGYPSVHDDFLKQFSAAYSEQLLKIKQERGRVGL